MITSIQKKKREEEARYQNIGISIRQVGMGDGIQFTSLPENFYHETGQKLIDVSKPWYFDYNPYVLRDVEPKKVIELWNYPKIYEWPKIRDSVYMNNAEIHASLFGIKNPKLIRPRLYRFEDTKFEERKKILFHPQGNSHGRLPQHVIDHVLKKYGHLDNVYQIGKLNDLNEGIPQISTPTLWELVQLISQCRMLIGVDSGPAWIAACYPDVVIKKIRTIFQYGYCEPEDWLPLDVKNCHSYWDDRMFQIYNCTESPQGFTESYRSI